MAWPTKYAPIKPSPRPAARGGEGHALADNQHDHVVARRAQSIRKAISWRRWATENAITPEILAVAN